MTEQWKYGDAGDRWPVQVGDIWKAGPHILACGDLERGAADELLDRFGEPDLTYTDPPWNAGNARAFRTKAGVGRPVDFDHLLVCILRAAARTKRSVFMETGMKQRDQLIRHAEEAGAQVKAISTITYYRKRPCLLFQLDWTGKEPVVEGLSGMDDDDTPGAGLGALKREGDLVFDPCLGRGLTVRTTHGIGLRFLGSELHPRRMACALDWLAEQGMTPEKLDSLKSMEGDNG